jgi:hypothetical protein
MIGEDSCPNVLFGNLQPELDGLPDVAQGFLAGLTLAPATGEGGATDRKTLLRFYQQNFIYHRAICANTMHPARREVKG